MTETVSLSTELHIDAVCEEFERAWKQAGARGPRAEDYLRGVDDSSRVALALELLALETEYSTRRGESVDLAVMAKRFPFLDVATITTRLERLLAQELTLPRQPQQSISGTRCPRCRQPLPDTISPDAEIVCSGCGSTFRLCDTGPNALDGARALGKFALLDRIGIGAFGEVWRARDTELHRMVALKIPHRRFLSAPRELERFRREARLSAQLRHSGIVSIHEVLTLEGLPVLVTEYIQGVSLKEFLESRHLPFRAVARLIADLADALHYAHSLNVVHRDVKPGNILLEHAGAAADSSRPAETLVPKILDFGLAVSDQAEVTLTQEGVILGTPAYMSPEQASGQGHRADRRSDIYSLGVVLYELLCGELPFRGSKMMVLQQILDDEPRPPSQLKDRIPRDLETICLKCLRKEPAHRYTTAGELAGDLRAYLAGEPIKARPPGKFERAWSWAKRRPAISALALTSTVAAFALIGVVTGAVYNGQLKRALDDAEEAREEAAQAHTESERARYFQNIVLAHTAWQEDNVARVRRLLDECPLEQRRWEWHYLDRLCHADLHTLTGHDGYVRNVTCSSDGRYIASAGWDHTARIWDTATGTMVHCLRGHDAEVWGVAFSPDSHTLASCSRDHTVRLWDVASGRLTRILTGHTDEVTGLAFTTDGERLASSSYDRTIRIWDVATGKMLRLLQGHSDRVIAVAFRPDGLELATACNDCQVRLWSTTGGNLVGTLAGHKNGVWGLAYSPDGKTLVSVAHDRDVRLWDVAAQQCSRRFEGHREICWGVAFSPDGERLATASGDGTIKIWDGSTGKELGHWKGHTGPVFGVAFHPDGTRLYSSSADGTIRVWDATIPPATPTWHGPEAAGVRAVSMSSTGTHAAAVYSDGSLAAWDVLSKTETFRVKAHKREAMCVAISSDGTLLASGGQDGRIHLWTADGNHLAMLADVAEPVRGLAFHPKKQWLLSGSEDGAIRLWDLAGSQRIRSMNGHSGWVTSVAFSPDGQLAASAGWDHTVRLWRVSTGEALRTLQGHTSEIWSVAFSPDGRSVASASGDDTARVWDIESGTEKHCLRGHTSGVNTVRFTADGTRIATASVDRTARLWDAATGQEILVLRGHRLGLSGLDISPDSSYLATSSHDGTVMFWDARPLRPARQ